MQSPKGVVLFAPPFMKIFDRYGREVTITKGQAILEDLNELPDYVAKGFLINFYFDAGQAPTL